MIIKGQACVGWSGKGWVSWWLSQLVLERGSPASGRGFDWLSKETSEWELSNLCSPLAITALSHWCALQARVGLSTVRFAWQEHRLCWPAPVPADSSKQNLCPLKHALRVLARWHPGAKERWIPAGGACISLDTAERVGGCKCRKISALVLSPFLWGCVWVPQHMASPFLWNVGSQCNQRIWTLGTSAFCT